MAVKTSNRRNPFAKSSKSGVHNSQQRGNLDRFEDIVYNVAMSRAQLMSKFFDPRRDINAECGYPETSTLTADRYQDLHERNPIANRVNEVLPKECFQVQPKVYETQDEDEITTFEMAWDKLGSGLRGESSWYRQQEGSPIWEYVLRADIASGIGHYGILLLGIDDGRELREPAKGVKESGSVPLRGRWESPTSGDTTRGDGEKGRELPNPKPRLSFNTKTKPPKGGWPRYRLSVNRAEQYAPKFYKHWTINRATLNRLGFGGKVTKDTESAADEDAVAEDEMPDAATSQVESEDGQLPIGAKEKKPLKLPEVEWKGRGLKYIRVFSEAQAVISQYENNPKSPRYGQPVMYQVTFYDHRNMSQASGLGLSFQTVDVHWTRIVHIADNLESGTEIFGSPRTRPVINRLLDLDKLYSGSAEMYWRGAFPGLSIETHPQLGGEVDIDETGLKDMMENYMNGLQRYLSLMGMSAQSLAPQVVDPTPQITTQLEAVCIKLGMPVRIFKGSERGELASSQDDGSWNDRLRHRQDFYVTPRIIVPLIDRLILLGCLPEPEADTPEGLPGGYCIEWPDLESMTNKEKADIANLRTQALAAYAAGKPLDQIIVPMDYFTRIWEFSEEEAQAIVNNAEQKAEEDMALEMETQKMMIEEGLASDPTAPPPPTEVNPNPVKMGAGQSLVDPKSGKQIAKGPPIPPKPKVAANTKRLTSNCDGDKACGPCAAKSGAAELKNGNGKGKGKGKKTKHV